VLTPYRIAALVLLIFLLAYVTLVLVAFYGSPDVSGPTPTIRTR
jgi:hypothetical protein